MKRTKSPPNEKSPKQREDLDPVTRQRLDRFLSRSRPKYPRSWAPDPAHPHFRRWVVDLTPQEMHAEILNRLKVRAPLITRILIAWPGAFEEEFGFPLPKKKKPVFPTFFSFLERITITDPLVEQDDQQFPMLSTSGPRAIAPEETSEELIDLEERHLYSIRNIRLRFHQEFLTWLFMPSPHADKSLAEYQELRQAITALGSRNRRRYQVINELVLQAPTVTLGGHPYAVPRKWKRDISSRQPPAEIARLFLWEKSKLDPQAIKELLAQKTKQAPITVAWTAYAQWLQGDPSRREDIKLAIHPNPMILAGPQEWPQD